MQTPLGDRGSGPPSGTGSGPGSASPMFAELVVAGAAPDAFSARVTSDLEIVVGDFVIRAGAGADEGQLTRVIRAARAAAS